jgi:hypothetical protein
MASTYLVLGTQTIPAANTNTDLYTVPGSGTLSAVVSSITICNQASTAATFNIAIRKAGTTLTTAMYIAYGTPIAGNDTIALTLGITLATTDVITVNSSSGNLSFAAFGSQIS